MLKGHGWVQAFSSAETKPDFGRHVPPAEAFARVTPHKPTTVAEADDLRVLVEEAAAASAIRAAHALATPTAGIDDVQRFVRWLPGADPAASPAVVRALVTPTHVATREAAAEFGVHAAESWLGRLLAKGDGSRTGATQLCSKLADATYWRDGDTQDERQQSLAVLWLAIAKAQLAPTNVVERFGQTNSPFGVVCAYSGDTTIDWQRDHSQRDAKLSNRANAAAIVNGSLARPGAPSAAHLADGLGLNLAPPGHASAVATWVAFLTLQLARLAAAHPPEYVQIVGQRPGGAGPGPAFANVWEAVESLDPAVPRFADVRAYLLGVSPMPANVVTPHDLLRGWIMTSAAFRT